MRPDFRRLMGEATRRTRDGDLGGATEAIRRALGGGAAGERRDGDGPDGEAGPFGTGPGGAGSNEAPGAAAARPGRHDGDARADAVRRPGGAAEAVILDGEWQRVDEPVDAPGPSPAPEPSRVTGEVPGGDGETTRTTARRGTDPGTGGRARATADGVGSVLRGRHEGGSGALDHRLYVPPRVSAVGGPALVVMLHGCTQDADDFALGTGMDRAAREHGALVLYPEQSPRANPQRCWNWFKHVHQRRGRGEPGAIEATVRSVIAEHAVDPARVFVAGLSAGGAMAANLGALCPDLFAAVGVHSGLAPGAARDLPGALAAMRGGRIGPGSASIPGAFVAAGAPPTIVVHGDADPTVHPDNGERVLEACLAGVTGDRTGDLPRVEREVGRDGGLDWTRRVHRGADGRPLAEHWLVHGAAHVWSGGDRRGSHASERGPDASRAMLRFFAAVAGAPS